jgi:hypothetical protein
MGAHVSYPLVIYHLVSMKRQFHLITADKFREVIKELTNYEIYQNSDNDHLPDHKLLADKLKYNQAKMNKILIDLLNYLIESFENHPLIIKDIVHILHVTPYIDPDEKNKDWIQKEWEKSITIPVVLPVTPKIGEYVEISFGQRSYGLSTEDKYYYGYVHDIRHTINGSTQEILIRIYSNKNFYYKWEEMKSEYERDKRWIASLRAERNGY